jgi:hypothetical protein
MQINGQESLHTSVTTNTISSWFHAPLEKVVQKCLAVACRRFAYDPVLILNRRSSRRQKFVPGYPLLRRPDDDLHPDSTGGVDSGDGVDGVFPEFSPPEPRMRRTFVAFFILTGLASIARRVYEQRPLRARRECTPSAHTRSVETKRPVHMLPYMNVEQSR